MKCSSVTTAAALCAASLLLMGSLTTAARAAEDDSTAQSTDQSMTTTSMSQNQKSANQDQMKQGQMKQEQSKQGDAANNARTTPVLILVPVTFAIDELANGCWARLYDSENFKGNVLTLVGPVDMPNTKPATVTGFEFGHNYGSIVTGPKAVLKVWDNDNFRDRTETFQPGQRVADLGDKMGFFEEVASLKIACR